MLDVPQNATEAQILMSFKKMAKKVHPDKNFDPRATETFQDLLKAKNVLMDSTMRKDFDQKLRCSYGETSYSLISSEKFPLKCTTTNIKVPYYLPQNRDCFTKYKPLGNLWEIMVVNNFWNTMRHACNAEMHYRDTLLEYARKMQMPSCDKLDFFTNGYY
ncbi:uncharacterized protein LOC6602760 [Drosophila persimilis]|uniref:uncharacterized protein LOC6602760 n=1 Tax=Drosophila persimilis TaxID=7234 RepID=UPI000F07DBF8|nr:uncharacterized protein LOC6602760 [Drosophila persimilis]